MAMILITCPHCGLGKEIAEERIPATAVSITCPQCKQRFEFSKVAAGNGSRQPPQSPPEEPAVTSAAGSAASVRITCPACGFFKELPIGGVIASRRTVEAREFEIGPIQEKCLSYLLDGPVI